MNDAVKQYVVIVDDEKLRSNADLERQLHALSTMDVTRVYAIAARELFARRLAEVGHRITPEQMTDYLVASLRENGI